MRIQYRRLALPSVTLMLPSTRDTRETVLPVASTVPAIADALVRLRSNMARNATAQQLAMVDAIARAVLGIP